MISVTEIAELAFIEPGKINKTKVLVLQTAEETLIGRFHFLIEISYISVRERRNQPSDSFTCTNYLLFYLLNQRM
ncbi:hypothetical protein CDT98_21225 [Cronobacter sakazakii]|nr:hypothetical protein CDT98_21225 [Cronobacter sakazakii]